VVVERWKRRKTETEQGKEEVKRTEDLESVPSNFHPPNRLSYLFI